jgi:hypothetical protein
MARSLISRSFEKKLRARGVEVVGKTAIADDRGSFASGLIAYKIVQDDCFRIVTPTQLDALAA